MSRDSLIRTVKRRAMKAQGRTFADRVRESLRTGTVVKDVQFTKGTKAKK